MTENTSLQLSNSRHDKVYNVQLQPQDGGFVVNFQYGARGSALQHGTKTKTPVPYEQAAKIKEKLIREKTEKPCSCCGGSYLILASAAPAPAPVAAPAKPISASSQTVENRGEFSPELLEPIETAGVSNEALARATAQYIASERYWMQKKFDGKRLAVRWHGGHWTGYNKLGKPIPVPENILVELHGAVFDHVELWLDGEYVQPGVYVIFDCIRLDGLNIAEQPYSERYAFVSALFDDPALKTLKVAEVYKSEEQKLEAFRREIEAKGEGVVFKKHSAPYMPGRKGVNLKLKFWKSATLRVCEKAPEKRGDGKDSYGVEALRDGKWVLVGHVTSKPGGAPPIGAFVEIKYLYVGRGGRLVQCDQLEVRDDVTASDCDWSQLKHQQAEEELVA